jgi:hypothetical protein
VPDTAAKVAMVFYRLSTAMIIVAVGIIAAVFSGSELTLSAINHLARPPKKADCNHGYGINLWLADLNILAGFTWNSDHVRRGAWFPHSHNVHMQCSA